MMSAAQSGSTRVVQNRANLDERDLDGNTALTLATRNLEGETRTNMIRFQSRLGRNDGRDRKLTAIKSAVRKSVRAANIALFESYCC
jgi:hypothetical protein